MKFQITFHERLLGEHFNNFPPPSSIMEIWAPAQDIEELDGHEINEMTLGYLDSVHNCGWWAWHARGGQCSISIAKAE